MNLFQKKILLFQKTRYKGDLPWISTIEVSDALPKFLETQNTVQVSVDLFRSLKNVEAVATERSMATSNIWRHLAKDV